MNFTSYSYTSLKMGISFSNWCKNIYIKKEHAEVAIKLRNSHEIVD